MKIQYIFGNLLDSDEKVIAHGCNSRGVMKSGIARDIRARYPRVYKDYYESCAWHNFQHPLGMMIESEFPDRIILNIISQKDYGRDPNVRYVSYDAIADAIDYINLLGYTRVAFPMIGAGLANGNWSIISSIIESYSNFEPIVYYIDERFKEKFSGQKIRSS